MVLFGHEIIENFINSINNIATNKRNDEQWKMFRYLRILENHSVFLTTDEHWHCRCVKNKFHVEKWEKNPYSMKNCYICRFSKEFNKLFEVCAQCYLRNETDEFHRVFRIILKNTDNLLYHCLILEEVFSKEYQYKSSYQGKYCNPMDIY